MKGLDPGQQHSLDMSRLGDKDAFHLPGVMCTSLSAQNPGDYVRIGDDFIVWSCDQERAHGVIDPMISAGSISAGRMFWVFLKREFVGPVTHNFDIVGVKNKKQPEPVIEDDEYDECRGCN